MNPKQESTDRIADKMMDAYHLLSALGEKLERIHAPEGTIPVEIEDLQLLRNWFTGDGKDSEPVISPTNFFKKYLP